MYGAKSLDLFGLTLRKKLKAGNPLGVYFDGS